MCCIVYTCTQTQETLVELEELSLVILYISLSELQRARIISKIKYIIERKVLTRRKHKPSLQKARQQLPKA